MSIIGLPAPAISGFPCGQHFAFSGLLPMTGSRHKRWPSTDTATGIAPESHRIPSSPPLPRGRHEVMMLFGLSHYKRGKGDCQFFPFALSRLWEKPRRASGPGNNAAEKQGVLPREPPLLHMILFTQDSALRASRSGRSSSAPAPLLRGWLCPAGQDGCRPCR